MKKRILTILLTGALMLSLFGCSKSEDNASITSTEAAENTEAVEMVKDMSVSCTSVNAEGKLLTVCAAKSASGENQSPAISWEAVDGAAHYAVCIFDVSASGWFHLKTIVDASTTSLEQGALDKKSYIGPYPPSGNHQYQIRVYALKAEPDDFGGYLDMATNDKDVEDSLNVAGKTAGNIIAKGTFDVYYASGDNNV